MLSNFDMIALQNFAKLEAVDGLVVCNNVAMCALSGCMGSCLLIYVNLSLVNALHTKM